RTWLRSSSSARRPSRATFGTSSRSSRPIRGRTRSRSRFASRSLTEGDAPPLPGGQGEGRQGERRREERDRIRLFEQLVAAEQDERRRLALFLHDGAVQSLSGIALMLDAVGHAIGEGRYEDAQQVLASALE